MVHSASVFSYELDDPALAAEEIKTQLKEKLTLKKNTVGILMCDPEFITSGVYQAVCEALPFPVAGTTTMTQAVNGEAGVLMLTLLVYTADDVSFEVGYTDPIPAGGDILAATRGAFEAARAKLPEAPKLVYVFPPLIAENGGDQYIDAIEALCPNVPVFGTLAVDDSIVFDNCSTLFNGEHSLTRMAFVLFSGDVHPRFFIGTVPEHNALPYSGEITKSDRHIVHEINDIRCSEYFENIGFAKDGKLDKGMQFVPFMLDMKARADWDGIPVVRAMVYFDENGAGVCRGYMYQNSVFTLVNPSSDDILESSRDLAKRVRALTDASAVLAFSCVVRRMAFGAQPLTEADMMVDMLRPEVPMMVAYSGGEICPTSLRANGVTNRFHNYSMICCVL